MESSGLVQDNGVRDECANNKLHIVRNVRETWTNRVNRTVLGFSSFLHSAKVVRVVKKNTVTVYCSRPWTSGLMQQQRIIVEIRPGDSFRLNKMWPFVVCVFVSAMTYLRALFSYLMTVTRQSEWWRARGY